MRAPVLRAVSGGATRGKVQAVVIGLVALVSTAAAGHGRTLAMKRVCGSLAERYARRTIQVADGQIASGVVPGARR